jgi:DNA-binding LacI/PurR family transcriptional regulator
MSTRLTLNDVARRAGVSRGTVSNVFTHPERVRPELRAKIETIAREIGYAGPDPRGRLLRAGRTNAIAFVIPGAYGIVNLLESPYGRELILGIGEACDARQIGLTLLDGRPERVEVAVRDALIDGLVLGHAAADSVMAAARQRQLPFVVLDTVAGSDTPAVAIDAAAGARDAARHLVQLGHRNFAIVSVRRTPGSPLIHGPGRNRRLTQGYGLDDQKLQGYAVGLAEAAVSIDETPIIEAVPWETEIGDALRLAAPNATAILVMADRLAITLLADAARRGTRVPEQLSIVGFDDVPEAAAAGLTTVNQPIRDKARRAAEMLLAEGPARQLVLPTTLVIRRSSGPAPI